MTGTALPAIASHHTADDTNGFTGHALPPHTHVMITDYMYPVCVLFLPPPPSPMPWYITSTTKTSNTFTSTASGVYIGVEVYLDFGTTPHHKVILTNLNHTIQ